MFREWKPRAGRTPKKLKVETEINIERAPRKPRSDANKIKSYDVWRS